MKIMIDYNKVRKGNISKKQEEELENASVNLPDKFNVEVVYVFDNTLMHDVDMYVVPYNQDREMFVFDVCFYNRSETDGIRLKNNASKLTEDMEECFFETPDLREEYEFVNLYVMECKSNNLTSFNNVEEIKVIVSDNMNQELFSYSFQNKNKKPNCFIGMLAKNSTGWKFYPAFQAVKEKDINEILVKDFNVRMVESD